MGDWKLQRLGDVLELKRGYDLPTSKRSPGPFPVVSSSGPTGFHSEWKVKGPGVVTGRYGTVGQVYYVQNDFWPLNTSLYVRDFKGNDAKFVYYYLKTLNWDAFNDKSGVPGVNRNHVHEALIAFPTDKDDQRRAASVLSVLDHKIDLNRRTNETLEAMARAVFKSWFVDFDPVHAKTAGKAPAHMDAETAALFPDAFGEDGLPVGWATKKVSDLASHLKGTVKPCERPEDDFLHFSLPAYDANRWPVLEKGADIKSNKTPVPEGVVLLSKLNPEVERVWLPPDSDKGIAICSTEFLVMAPAGPASRSYIYSLFCSQRFRSQYQGLVTGTSKSHQRVQPKSLLELPVVVAEETVIRAFDSLVEPMLKKTVANIHENQTLADLRDLLLPKLMSGELRLRDAEKIIEGAA